jgi:hypothetical protein
MTMHLFGIFLVGALLIWCFANPDKIMALLGVIFGGGLLLVIVVLVLVANTKECFETGGRPVPCGSSR